MDAKFYGVTFRLQDELHLLRDSLGAVDAHYEALFDHFQETLSGSKPKILASSATLAGYERQSKVLYGREARVFPQEICRTPDKWVMLFRTSMFQDIEDFGEIGPVNLIYSLWPGYLERKEESLTDWCRDRGIIIWQRHTSGHADLR